jgi:hypothetical protein
MTKLNDLTTAQILQIIAVKEQIETLQGQIDSIIDSGGEVPSPSTVEAPAPAKRKYHITAAHKRKLIKALAKARKIRWAKANYSSKPAGKRRKMSAAAKAKIAAAARARWARAKAEGKNAL